MRGSLFCYCKYHLGNSELNQKREETLSSKKVLGIGFLFWGFFTPWQYNILEVFRFTVLKAVVTKPVFLDCMELCLTETTASLKRACLEKVAD